MSTNTKNRQKYLSRKTTEILYIIGSSNKPLIPREIEEEWFDKFRMRGLERNKRRDSDVYRVIYQLAGFSTIRKSTLFYLSDIENLDNNFKLKLLRKISRLFNLHLTNKEIDSISPKLQIEEEVNGSSKNLKLSYIANEREKLSLIIEINEKESKGSISLIKPFKVTKFLELEKKYDRIVVYVKQQHIEKKGNLRYILQDNQQNIINILQQKRKLYPDLSILNEKGVDSVFIEDIKTSKTKGKSHKIQKTDKIEDKEQKLR
ncbi:MAG TPA: hypothetical protein VK250_02145 [Nitrososphaeraceae archaeon]|nr:hypothetical protein [Nitrososphaeraceae archaeon]